MNAIETHDLCKSFHGIYAVENLNLTVPEGAIYGFIGENGSGKSTTEKLICGLLVPTHGKIKLYGKPCRNPAERAQIGTLIEDPACFPGSTVYQNMMMQTLNLDVKDPEDEIARVLDLVQMTEHADKKFGKCSLGMKQRIGIAQALLGHPKLLVLDEPINGLDTEGCRIVRETLQYINREEGVTILITSHILDELSKIATHYGIIKEGRLIQQIRAEQMSERCRDHILVRTANDMKAFGFLRRQFETETSESGIKVYGEPDSMKISAMLMEEKIPVVQLETKRIGLEEYYIGIMEEARSA